MSSEGGVCRNEQGVLLFAFSEGYGVGSNISVELRATNNGLHHCITRGHLSILIELDSQLVIDFLAGAAIPSWKWKYLLSRIENLKLFGRVQFTNIYREGNGLADAMARIGSSSQSLTMVNKLADLPAQVRGLLFLDKVGFWAGGLLDPAFSLSGRIDPALFQLKHLQFLDLSLNAFNGAPIPDFLGSIKELRHLNLSRAGFSGIIPHQLGNLTKLVSLKLSSSSLSAKNLWWLTSLPSLKYLDMSYVNLSMASHDWVHVMNMSPSLIELKLFRCGLSYISPTLPYVNFTSLRVLDLRVNNFNSTIPNWIANISSLVSLDLSYNNFHGEVPHRFSQLPNLEELWLGSTDDNLRVDWSEFLEGSWRKLKILYLSFSQLHGGIPNSIWNITSLESLSLSFSENITGSIPRAITKLINLESLSLDGYHMHAAIPDWLYELKSLKRLTLKDCMLTGPIPAARLGGLSSLEKLYLSSNQLNGNIPAALGGLSSLQRNVSQSLFENLKKLKSLYLDSNTLLSSLIPLSMSNLTFLSHLNLSYNNLSGRIPTGNQLRTLEDPSIYIGNNGLCGPPLTEKCGSDETSQGPMPVSGDVKKDEEEYEISWFYFALGPGFAIEFWAFCGILMLKKSWRIAYYRFFDEMKDRLF
ncbi:receptor-like protein EIX1 [Magnolia sinica]|uniref:receptor-like protein EIX1 n=1 Tax=Magnolia sinica TaxID=86752 RepID=UPI002658FDF1|nr:receptor-like protein EIX1 [Magnolia sinica]